MTRKHRARENRRVEPDPIYPAIFDLPSGMVIDLPDVVIELPKEPVIIELPEPHLIIEFPEEPVIIDLPEVDLIIPESPVIDLPEIDLPEIDLALLLPECMSAPGGERPTRRTTNYNDKERMGSPYKIRQ